VSAGGGTRNFPGRLAVIKAHKVVNKGVNVSRKRV